MDDIGADDDGGVLSISEEGDGFSVRDGVDAAEFNVDSAQRVVSKYTHKLN